MLEIHLIHKMVKKEVNLKDRFLMENVKIR